MRSIGAEKAAEAAQNAAAEKLKQYQDALKQGAPSCTLSRKQSARNGSMSALRW